MENVGLIGLSRQIALRRELDVIANNVANVSTTGFKADKVVFEEFLMPVARWEDFPRADRRLSYTQDRATFTDFSAGPVKATGNPLDVALDGNALMVVETPQGERFTRNGALQLNANGDLVTSEGHRVLGTGGPIVMQPGDRDVAIGRDGLVTVNGGAVRGTLRLVRFENPQSLIKAGDTLFQAPQGTEPQPATGARVLQGHLETANVKPVIEISRMLEITRAYQSVTSMLERYGDLRRDAIDKLAQIPT
jgi:flagellar basal-body rod protein FlgF